ncbi:hypothetical protein ACIBQ2_27785 [Micromonospora sediminimaris]|uniref:hypothetical protein n=1 Tax=Micromonospora sediminimaris TaxID=547162 RepID=UPI0037BB748D
MREYTNLQWPEAPFGADQRPFGRQRDMLAAFALAWANLPGEGPLPVAAATVYLGVRRHGSAYEVGEESLSIGFRADVVEDRTEIPALLRLTDRALTRARRHAAILAGHRLGDDLSRMATLSAVPLRGAAGVLAAWVNRAAKQRGMALMVDTSVEASDAGADLDMPLEPLPRPLPQCPASAAETGRYVLGRGLAIGLTAAVHAGRYRWEGTFRVTDAVDRAAWDVLEAGGTEHYGHDTAHPPVARAAG